MDLFDKFYNKSLRFLSFRPRSEKEIIDYLKKKKADVKLITQIIEKLKEQKFLNDEEFAKMWIEQRMEFKPRAWRLIKIELKRKGITEEIIESIVQNSPASASARFDSARREAGRAEFRIQNDLEMAKKLVKKRIERYKGVPKEKVYEKLMRFLASKGFDYETIKEVLKNVLS